MNLSPQQHDALQRGETIELMVDACPCVLVAREVYDRLRRLAYDDSEWTEDERMILAGEAAEDLDRMDEIQ